MNIRVLVAYASAMGSTIKVAAAIGETLADRGLAVDVVPIKENPPVGGYQAVVLGSAVQRGHWLPEALEYLEANLAALRQVPVAAFCVHITNTGNDAQSRRNRLGFLDDVRRVLQPVDEGYFAGRFDRHGAALLLPGPVAQLVPPIDLRQWDKIRSWAESAHPHLERAA